MIFIHSDNVLLVHSEDASIEIVLSDAQEDIVQLIVCSDVVDSVLVIVTQIHYLVHHSSYIGIVTLYQLLLHIAAAIDGGDLVHLLHTTRTDAKERLIGGSEETTTGVHRLHAVEAAGELDFPLIAVNDSQCKFLFDNRYGTGQSVWDGIMRTTNLTVAGKNVVVAGYGWCGKGVAMRARGLGAHVYVTEVDPIKAVEAVFDGFKVLPMNEAAPIGDLFVTVTGCNDVVRAQDFPLMKDGAIVCNAGHFDVEVNVKALAEMAVKKESARQNIDGYTLENGRTIYVLAEGRLVNLAAGDGHPAEIMDLSFAMQALAANYLITHESELEKRLYILPKELDDMVAGLKLAAMGYGIDALTEEQIAYLTQVD